ncbi:hypothetical protein [Escherichia coli]|uniref:hypothetical protein n=1 Tax=Escherichia coli TaxID=562 RepID=UPI000BE2050E|nr:hypothetical protein [Escherichia coli]
MSGTTRLTLTDNWQQVTNGKETKLLQCKGFSFAVCSSSTAPGKDQAYHLYSDVLVTPPTVAWVRSVIQNPLTLVVTGE